MSWSSDGSLLACASYDNKTSVFDAKNEFKLLSQQSHHLFCVNGVAISPDKLLLASCSDYRTVCVFSIEKNELLWVQPRLYDLNVKQADISGAVGLEGDNLQVWRQQNE